MTKHLIAQASSHQFIKLSITFFALFSLIACGDDQAFPGESSENLISEIKPNNGDERFVHPTKGDWKDFPGRRRGKGKHLRPTKSPKDQGGDDRDAGGGDAFDPTTDAGAEADLGRDDHEDDDGGDDWDDDDDWGDWDDDDDPADAGSDDAGSDDADWWTPDPGEQDAGEQDAGEQDAGGSSEPDSGSSDAGSEDSGSEDSGSSDSGSSDSGSSDSGSEDSGSSDAGGWTPGDEDAGSGTSDTGGGTSYVCADDDGVCGSDCDFTDDNDCALDCRDPSTWPQSWEAIEDQVLQLTNAERAAGATCDATYYGPQPPLTFNAELREAARCHSLDMAVQNFFSHTSSNGDTLSDRINATGYNWTYISENIAVGFGSPGSVVGAWMNSPGHCHNVMSTNTELGVGYVYGVDGGSRRLWTQDYGRPR